VCCSLPENHDPPPNPEQHCIVIIPSRSEKKKK
jgi:hypothetical protein